MNRLSLQISAVTTAWLGLAATSLAQSGTWINPAGGSWAAAANWSNNVIATGIGSTADFSRLTLTAAPTVTLDGGQTNGYLIFGDAGNTYGWTLVRGSGGSNTLAVASGTPSITVNGQTTTISNVLVGSQGVIINGPGTLLLTATNVYTGGTTINNGLVQAFSQYAVGANNTAVTAVTVNNGATLDINGMGALSGGFWYGITIAGTGTAGQGALINNGANGSTGQRQTSNLALSGNASIGGSGTIYMIGSSYSADTLTMAGYTLTKIGANTFNLCNTTVSGGGSIVINSGTIGQYHTASTASGTAFVLANASGVTLNLTSLALSIGSLTGGGANGGNVILGTSTLTVGGDNTSLAAFAGVISGTGGLTKVGTGTLTLSGGNNFTGATTVSNGALLVSGSVGGPVIVRSGGLLGVGTNATLGTMTLANTLTFSAGSTNFLRISKTGGTAASDEITGFASASLAGTLVVTNITSDATPLASGDTFTLFNTAGSYSGGFSSILLPALPTGLSWNASQLTVNGTITVINSAATPVFNPAGGGYVGALAVTMSSLTTGATIYYTTNGSTPTTSSLVYSAPIAIPVNTTVTIKAIAAASGFSSSAVASATYVTEAAAVWTNLAGGSWAAAANWTNNIIGQGVGATADFSQLALTTGASVTLDSVWTIGNLIFGDQANANTWEIDPGTGGPLTLAAGSAPTINVSNQTATITAVLAGTNGLTKTGAGWLTISAKNTYTGLTTVAAGTLELAGDGNTSFSGGGGTYSIANGAVLQEDNALNQYNVGSQTVVNIAGGGELAWNATQGDTYSTYLNTVNLDSSDGLPAVVNATVGDSAPRFGYYTNGLITSVGTTVANQWEGNIMLVNGSGYTLTFSNTAELVVSGGMYDLTGYPGESVIKKGSGTLVFQGSSTTTGSMTMNAGTLEMDGSSTGSGAFTVNSGAILDGVGTIYGPVTVAGGGTLEIGTNTTVGSMDFGPSVTFNAGSTNIMRISKTGGNLANDQLVGASILRYGGTLVVNNITSDSTPLALGDSFNLFNGISSYSGSFSAFVLPALSSGLSWNVSQLSQNGTISIVNAASTPTISPAGGVFISPQPLTVTISSVTAGATIYYTLNGSTPTSASPSGTTPVTVIVPVNTNITIQAYAHETGYQDSGVASATFTTEAAAVWTNAAGGSWSTPGNWTNDIIGQGLGVTADFSQLTLSSNLDVTLDGPWTIGNLVFGDVGNKYKWEIDNGGGGPLTLAATNVPTISVLNQTAAITAVVAGTNGFTKAGGGWLTLTGTNTYTGVTTVAAGTLELAGNGNASFSVGGGTYVVENGAVLQEDNADLQYNVGDATVITVLGGGELAWRSTGGDAYSTYLNTLNLNSSNGAAATVNTTLGNSVPRFGAYANGLITSSGAVTNLWNGGLMLANLSGFIITISNAGPLSISGPIRDLTGYAGAPLFKEGAGRLILNGASTYAGPTTVSQGTLQVNGSIFNGGLTVETGGVLNGSGSVSGITTVEGGGVIEGGAGGASALTLATLNLGSNGLDTSYSEFTVASGGEVAATTLNVNGTHIVNILDASLSVATNTLFTYAGGSIGGSSGFAGFQLGALPSGVTAHLLNTGSAVQLAVTSSSGTVSTNSPTLAFALSGHNLALAWPTTNLGWALQVQTNHLPGVSGNPSDWMTIPGSTTINQTNITINATNAAEFFRLVYP